MQLKQYQVDAFTTRLFAGNPAAVVALEKWLPEELMQAIAAENNLAETAFFVPAKEGYELRWFTPLSEVELCGHATLAAAHVLFAHERHTKREIVFTTRGGELRVARRGEALEMSFPARPPAPCKLPRQLLNALGQPPAEVLAADDYLAVYPNEEIVRRLAPDMATLVRLDRRGVAVTARGSDFDFVSRFFAPKLGVPEDPVTGSAHCELAPFWAERTGKTRLRGFQCSPRGGEVGCTIDGDRIVLSGHARTFMEAKISVQI